MTNDSVLFYNVGKWSEFGLAVPNFGNDKTTQNVVINNYVQVCGRNLAAIMWHTDARLRTPPSINTLTRMHKLCVRARTLLSSAAVPAGTPNMESAHNLPAPEVFTVYPTPFFKVRNSWLKNYAQLTLLSVAEAMQHQENAKPLEISTSFAGLVGQYVQRVYRMMATDLFGIPLADAERPDFTLTEEMLRAYNPAQWFTSTELIDTVPDLENWPTEDDLAPLTDGIPVTQLPVLGRYPTNPDAYTATASGGTASATSAWLSGPQP